MALRLQGQDAFGLNGLDGQSDLELLTSPGIPTYEPSNTVTMMWVAFGIQVITTLYIASRGVIFPANARMFHTIFAMNGLCASMAYLMEAGALEYLDLHSQAGSNLDPLSVPPSPWRLPCSKPFTEPGCPVDPRTDVPMCAIIPYYTSRIIIQSNLIYGISFLAGTPNKERLFAIALVALMELCNFLATLFKAMSPHLTMITVISFSLRLVLMVPLIYFLLHGIEFSIRRAPVRVRGVCHGWCCTMVVLQFWNVIVWGLAYGTGLMSLFSLLGCRVVADMMSTIFIPLLVLRDTKLIMMVKERDDRLSTISRLKAQRESYTQSLAYYQPLSPSPPPSPPNYKNRALLGAGGHDEYYNEEDTYEGYETSPVVQRIEFGQASEQSFSTAATLPQSRHTSRDLTGGHNHL